MGEVYDEELSLNHWFDPQGQKRPFGEIQIEKDEVVGLDDETRWHTRQEVHEATGNEGASVERWYRQGVVVIWPREHYFGIMVSEGPATAIPVLEEMADQAEDEATLEACHRLAGEIIRHWKPQRTAADATISWSGRILKLLALVCTKTRGQYERSLKQYETDKQLLLELGTLAGSLSKPASNRQAAKRSRVPKS